MALVPKLAIAAVLAVLPARLPAAETSQNWRAMARSVLAELVAIDTTHERGATAAALAVRRHLAAAGLPEADLVLAGPRHEKQNLVARYRGSGDAAALLYILHLDVVAANGQGWSTPPFTLVERDGFLHGRGTSDTKGKVAALVTALVRLHREGFQPSRDIVVALTDDEERGPVDTNGVRWLLANRRDLLASAAMAINPDIGGGERRRGVRQLLTVQTSEKTSVSFVLEATDRGGHSALPHPGNPITRIAAALGRIEKLEFPAALSETTRGYFAAVSGFEKGQLAADLAALAHTGNATSELVERVSSASDAYAALLRTTCVATEISGGHAGNALPQAAKATVNCRILPGETVEATEAALKAAVGDDGVKFSRKFEPRAAPASPLLEEVMTATRSVAAEVFPGVPVAPVMSVAASDSLHLRAAGIPTYGISGLFEDVDDVRAHGVDERISAADFDAEVEFTYRLLKALAGGAAQRTFAN